MARFYILVILGELARFVALGIFPKLARFSTLGILNHNGTLTFSGHLSKDGTLFFIGCLLSRGTATTNSRAAARRMMVAVLFMVAFRLFLHGGLFMDDTEFFLLIRWICR